MKPLLLISFPSRHMWHSTVYTLSNSGFDKLYATPWLPDNPHTILKERTIFTRLSVRQTLQSSAQLSHPSTHIPPTQPHPTHLPTSHPPTHTEARARRIPTDSVIGVIYCSMGTTNWHLCHILLLKWILKNSHVRNWQLFCLLHSKSQAWQALRDTYFHKWEVLNVIFVSRLRILRKLTAHD